MIPLNRLWDWFLLLICNFIWATQFVLVKIVQEQMGPAFATFFPMTLATILLIPLVARQRKAKLTREGLPAGRMPASDIRNFALLAIGGQVVAQLFITWGVRWSLAMNGAVLMLALPVCTAVWAFVILRERMSSIRWISFGLAIVGVVACSQASIDWESVNLTSGQFFLGNAMIFLSVNGSAFYNTYSKKLLRRYDPLEVLYFTYIGVFLFMLPVTLYVEPLGFLNLPKFRPEVWIGLLLLATFQYFLSMVIFLRVLSRLDATQAGLCNYLITFFGVPIAVLVRNEPITKFMIVGGLLVLVSTILITVYEERERARTEGAGVSGSEGPT